MVEYEYHIGENKMCWIKLHRKFIKWEWFDKPEMVQVFIYCLLNANHEDKKWQGKIIKRGQFVTSYKRLTNELGLSVQQIRTIMGRLKSTSEITSESTSQYTLITICNYDTYQDNPLVGNTQINTHINKPSTNHQQTSNKRATTTKEYKEDKNIKEIGIYTHACEEISFPDPPFEEVDISFESAYELYDKHGDEYPSRMQWGMLTMRERALAMQHIPLYKKARPNKQFRKQFENYLYNKTFLNDNIQSYENTTTNQSSGSNLEETARAIDLAFSML